MILVKSPWPEARIHLPTALSVALPLGFITIILLRFAIAAKRRKAVTGEAGMIGLVGVAQYRPRPGGESAGARRIVGGTRGRANPPRRASSRAGD